MLLRLKLMCRINPVFLLIMCQAARTAVPCCRTARGGASPSIHPPDPADRCRRGATGIDVSSHQPGNGDTSVQRPGINSALRRIKARSSQQEPHRQGSSSCTELCNSTGRVRWAPGDCMAAEQLNPLSRSARGFACCGGPLFTHCDSIRDPQKAGTQSTPTTGNRSEERG